MSRVRPAIWIQALRPERAPAAPPNCSGPAEQVAAVLQALSEISELEPSLNIVNSGRVVALDIGPDEATLTLRMGDSHCHGAQGIGEQAFDVLRAQLPDTDLFLRHDYAKSCASALGQPSPLEDGAQERV